MRVLIVDDEPKARAMVVQLLRFYAPQVTAVAEASGLQSALEAIRAQVPDLLLLDIQLGDGNGFELLERLSTLSLNVIFITAYNDYAIRAFKVSAIDYVLKPIDPDHFAHALQLAQQRLKQKADQRRLHVLLDNLRAPQEELQKITLNTAEGFYIVSVKDIIFCEAHKNYTTFHLVHQSPITISKSLGEYEALLPSQQFMRPHQSYLVNIAHISSYLKGEKNCLVTVQGDEIPVAVRKREWVMNRLKHS